MTRRDFRAEAKAFLIWRAAQSVNWDCSIADAAREAGVSPGYASDLAQRRGWTHKFNSYAACAEINSLNGRSCMAATQRKKGLSFDAEALELTELIQ